MIEPGEVQLPPLGPTDVLVSNRAIGVNFIDVYLRSGLYPVPQLPMLLGVEGAGVVEGVGSDVESVSPGDRVAYAGPPIGSYAAARVLPQARLIGIPDPVSFETAAAAMLRGLTAHMLLTRVRATAAGDWILVHAGAGGLGQMLTRWAVGLGARVIATVGGPEKQALAQAAGADHVLLHGDPDLAVKVREITGGLGVDAAYDGIGGDMLLRTLDCVRPFGLVASTGQAAGPIPNLPLEALGPRKALTLSRPSVMLYASDADRYRAGGAELMARLAEGLPVAIGARYPLAQARDAHEALEQGRTTGSVILIP
ncbi:quinone oxidoreductase [Phenylobacterium sp.]|uniref:quinone oxidoreductase family protein n=1 Tax=Phenylobacterium sp. TaxID=1871053 RepID=UPI002E35C22F|nr:quinone oxidoreductase [Phenylobacterium sp.]HEX4709004.1 quinone oxidoreductase [Phenylobacterium sp.]